MKIFHGPKSWNNQAENLSKAEILIGLDSKSFKYRNFINNPSLLIDIIKNCDVFNFYTCYTFLPISLKWNYLYSNLGGMDLFVLKKFNKKIILHFQGCDIRHKYHKSLPEVCKFCNIKDTFCREKLVLNRRKRQQKLIDLADAICVTTPDLHNYINRDVYLIPKISPFLDTSEPKFFLNVTDNSKLRIIHAPTNRSIKGTDHIINVVNKHNDKFELIVIENKPKKEVLTQAKFADIAIDQLIIGWYGNFAVEMMAMGIPVINFISEDLNQFALKSDIKLPFIQTDVNNLENVLLSLIDNISILKKASIDSLNFVNTFHSQQNIAEKMLNIYNKILN